MEIRLLDQHELSPALHLVWDVFVEDVAPSYSHEGVATFQEFIKYENINQMYQNKEVLFWGAYEGEELCGVIALQTSGHICLFFVKKSWQGKGVGKRLYQSVYHYCAQDLRISRLTVNAVPGAVIKYQHFGMRQVSGEQYASGMCFVPMEAFVTVEVVQPVSAKKSPALVIAIAAGAVFLLAVLIGGFFLAHFAYRMSVRPPMGHYRNHSNGYYHRPWCGDFYGDYGDYGNYDDYDDYDEYDWRYDSQNYGLNAIDVYQAPGLSYEMGDEVYEYQDEKKRSTLIVFQVKYPQLSGGADNDYAKVNEAIKECAMATVEEIYTNPTDIVKENVLKAKAPALVSSVNYKVCYATDNFISIVFQDEHAKGDANLYDIDLRTINIGLKDGKIYEVKDIVELSDTFVEEWLDEMRDEADNNAFLSELSKEEMKKALAGDSMNGVYTSNFFVHADGIEIGYDLNYPQGSSHNLGYAWVTAAFDFDEIEPYLVNDDFQDRLDR